MAERLRLLVVNPSPIRGGAEELLLGIARHADPERLDVTFACLSPGPFVEDLKETGARVVEFDAGRLRYPWMWARTVAHLREGARLHDAVLSWQVKGHYYGTPAAALARRPSAWWDHGIRPAEGERRYLIDNVLPRTVRSGLVVTSSREAAARHRNARAIHPGIPLEPYDPAQRPRARQLLGVEEDEQVVGIVGRLQPWKGQHVLLRAAPSILKDHPRALFVVIGGTPGGFSASYPDELRALAAELGVAERVRFMGQRDDVPALLPGLDLFVMASDAEPFGLVTVEAMASGVAVVATNNGGTPEIVTDGVTGVLVPPRDEASLAGAVSALLEDPTFAARLAAAAREDALRRFSIQRYVRDVEDLAHELAASR